MILYEEKSTTRFALIYIGILVAVFGVWGGFAPLNSAVVAPGQVNVIDNKLTVQHLEGGVVDKIYVKDGDEVKAGDVLLEIKNASFIAQLQIVENEYLQTSVTESRLKAAVAHADAMQCDSAVAGFAGYAEACDAQKEIFATQKQLLHDELAILSKRIEQLNEQKTGTQALLGAKNARAASLGKERAEWDKLYKEQLVSKINLRNADRELVATRGEAASASAELARLDVAISEAQSQRLLRQRTYDDENLKQLEATTAKLTEVKSRYEAIKDQLERTKIKAPASGVVVDMKVNTPNSVIRSSEEIMSIVPRDVEYIVKAKMQIKDIDKVKIGAFAELRFSAFDVQHAHETEGVITYISADALTDSHGVPYYEIKAKLSEQGEKFFEANGFYMLPGMPVEVMVKTGERTLLSYLVNPFVNMFKRSLNED